MREREADWGYVQGNDSMKTNKMMVRRLKVDMIDGYAPRSRVFATRLHSRPHRRMRLVRHCIYIHSRSASQWPLGSRYPSPPRQGDTLTSITRRGAPSARRLKRRCSSYILHLEHYKGTLKKLLTFLKIVGHLRHTRSNTYSMALNPSRHVSLAPVQVVLL